MLDYDNKNKIYICHFPGNTRILQEQVKKQIKEKFLISNKISLVCAFNQECLTPSGLLPFYDLVAKDTNILFEEGNLYKEWNMELKISSILKSLKRCRTEYALVTDVRDVLITANLDNEFIKKFEDLKCDIVYNATTSKYPKVNLPSDYIIEGGSGPFKYLNAGVCFGKTDKLIEWYEHCNVLFENNKSEQFVIRSLYEPRFNIKIDGERKLFRSCHAYDTIFFKNKKDWCFAYTKDAYTEVDKKLRYKKILPNGKIQKGKIKIEEFNENRIFYETELKKIDCNTVSDIKSLAKRRNTKLKTFIINYKNDIFNDEIYSKLIPILKIIDKLVINVYEADGINYLLNKIKNNEFNCINKIIFNMYIRKKDFNFPSDERLNVKYITEEDMSKTRTYKIIDTKHSGYYKIKLHDTELYEFRLKNNLLPEINAVRVCSMQSYYSNNYWNIFTY